jgi:hypothetical protein
MIGFLYPILGLAALAVAVPVVLHLIRRRDVKRLAFPAIRYLRRAERRHARRLRLRHLALLAIRMVMVALLAFAAMGPLLGRGGAADHHPTALAIIIDDSQSSSRIIEGQRLLDLFAERASRTLDLSTGDDRVAFFSAVRPDQVAISGVTAIRSHLSELRPVAGMADLGGAAQTATEWLQSVAEGRQLEIQLLTDLQAVSLPVETGEPGRVAVQTEMSVVVFVPRLPVLANGTPGRPIPEVVPLSAGRHTTIMVPLHWFGTDEPTDPVVVRLVSEEDVIAIGEAIYGGQALIRMPPQESGWVQGYVEIDNQGLAADDRRYFTWFVRPTVEVAAVGTAGGFLINALEALEAGRRLRQTEPDAAEVWVSAGGERVSEGLAGDRSVLVIPPTSPLDLPRLNARLARARIPWRYDTDRETGASRIAGSDVPGLTGLEVRSFYRLMPSGTAAADTTLVGLASGEPWLVRGTTSQGAAYLLLASPLTAEATDLPASAGMVPFLDILLGDWARGGIATVATYHEAGPVRLSSRAREIRSGEGTQTAEGGAWLDTAQPGNYSVLDDANVIQAFSVNAPLLESDLEAGSAEALEATFPAADWVWSANTDVAGWERVIYRARRGRLAWTPLVALLLAFSIVEASLAAAGRRSEERPRTKTDSD